MIKVKVQKSQTKTRATSHSSPGRGDSGAEVCVQNQPEKIKYSIVESFKSLHELGDIIKRWINT